jgi:hypothetical protein
MPVILKILLNILFYFVYVVIFGFLAWIAYYLIITQLYDSTLSEDVDFYNNFAIIAAFVTLILSILLKRYFYIWLEAREEDVIIIED